jgi:hypothetical protein
MMQSKLSIDIDTSGLPQIRIDYHYSDDIRDRLVGRFLDKMGIPGERTGFWAYCRLGHQTQSKQGGYYDGAVAVIEPMDEDVLGLHMPEIQNILKEPDLLKQVDNMCVQSLDPDLYQRWSEIMWTLKANRKAFKKEPNIESEKDS